MLLEIAQLGQPILREVAQEVPLEFISTPEFQQFLQDMIETLRHEKGAGLAAPQVFVGERVFLAAVLPPDEPEGPAGVEIFINPKLTPLSEEQTEAWEGCLSFPELLVLVPRYRMLRVEYLNERGQRMMRELSDFSARVVQHEFDHVEGILTIDRAVSTGDIVKASEIETVMESRREE